MGGDRREDPSCVPPQQWKAGHQRCRLRAKGRGATTTAPAYRATTSRRLSGLMTTAMWWACRGLVGPPIPIALGVHAVVWRNGSVSNLPGLGGAMNNAAIAINNAGQIAGISDPPGDTTRSALPDTRGSLAEWRDDQPWHAPRGLLERGPATLMRKARWLASRAMRTSAAALSFGIMA